MRRGGKWEKISTERLLPGDVFSLRAPDGNGKAAQDSFVDAQDIAVPCDGLLVGGTLSVSEAALTGEATPLVQSPFYLKTRCVMNECRVLIFFPLHGAFGIINTRKRR